MNDKMTKTITVNQLKELLQIQKDFDSRIPTLNLQDSKVAYVVEFFEWFNTLETFKNWKKNPGKPLDVQLDELADMLAFGLSVANQQAEDMEEILEYVDDGIFYEYLERVEINFNDRDVVDEFMSDIDEIYDGWYDNNLFLPFAIANNYYSIDQLITAYKKKMERNHKRQDGLVDKDKGYVQEDIYERRRELIEKLEVQVMDLGRLDETKDLESMDKRATSIYISKLIELKDKGYNSRRLF